MNNYDKVRKMMEDLLSKRESKMEDLEVEKQKLLREISEAEESIEKSLIDTDANLYQTATAEKTVKQSRLQFVNRAIAQIESQEDVTEEDSQNMIKLIAQEQDEAFESFRDEFSKLYNQMRDLLDKTEEIIVSGNSIMFDWSHKVRRLRKQAGMKGDTPFYVEGIPYFGFHGSGSGVLSSIPEAYHNKAIDSLVRREYHYYRLDD